MSQVSSFSLTNVGIANVQIEESTGKIMTVDLVGNSTHIGFSVKAYNELKKLAEDAISKTEEYKKKMDEYEQKLVDAGLMKRPMTQEEQMSNMLNAITQLSTSLQTITSELADLKGRVDGLPKNTVTRKNYPSE